MVAGDDVTVNAPVSESIEKIRPEPVGRDEVDVLSPVDEISEVDDRLDVLLVDVGKEI